MKETPVGECSREEASQTESASGMNDQGEHSGADVLKTDDGFNSG